MYSCKMPNVLVLIVVLFSVLSSSKCGKMIQKSTSKEILKYISEKCKAATGGDRDSLMQINMIQMHSCLLSSQINKTEDLYTITCEVNTGYKCAEMLMSTIEPCLNQDEKYLSNFVLSAHNESVAEICKDGKEMFLNLLEMLKESECIKNKKIMQTAIGCANILNDVEFDKLILSQQFVCRKLDEYRKCFVSDLEQNCINDGTVDLVKKAFEPYTHWCNNN